jgi:hypothetical protein
MRQIELIQPGIIVYWEVPPESSDQSRRTNHKNEGENGSPGTELGKYNIPSISTATKS